MRTPLLLGSMVSRCTDIRPRPCGRTQTIARTFGTLIRVSEHYFSQNPRSDAESRTLTVNLRGSQFEVTTQGGIFSPGGLDKGTAVLLDKVPSDELEPGAVVVDIGCGWGPITLALADQYPHTRVTAVDVNERALELTQLNAAAAGFDNVAVREANEALAEFAREGKGIDLIWANPPIRIGKAALHDLLTGWLSQLNDDGRAYLVVQRNLGADSLANWLTEQGFPTTKVGSSKGFRVLQSHKS